MSFYTSLCLLYSKVEFFFFLKCRTSKNFELDKDNDETSRTHTKCIPRSIKASITKQPRSESMRSPLSEGPRISSDGVGSSRITSDGSNAGSKRYTEPSVGKKQPKKPDSTKDEKENVIRIEES